MNRAERRKAGKKDKVRTYTLTDVQIQQIKHEAAREAFIDATLLSYSCKEVELFTRHFIIL